MSTSLRSWRRSYTRAARASVSKETGDQSTAGGTGAYDGTEATSTGYVAASMPETPPSCTALSETWAGRAAYTVPPSAGSDECDKEHERCSTISLQQHTCLLAHHVLELPLPDDEPPLYPDEESDQDESDEEEDQDDEELSE